MSPHPTHTDDPAERRARHLACAQEILATTMQLFRAAAARAAGHAMALENRIADGNWGQPRTRFRPATPPDPRRAMIRPILHELTQGSPDAAQTRRELEGSLDAALAADPAGIVPAIGILGHVAAQCGIRLELSQLPDEILLTARNPHPAPRSNL